MKLNDISKPLTAAQLNENLAKKFGQKIKLEDYTREQLENVRNKLRTKLSQVETLESFDSVNNENYQKNKMFLDVLNAAIKEMDENESMKFHKKNKRGKAKRKHYEDGTNEAFIDSAKDVMEVLGSLRKMGKQIERGDIAFKGPHFASMVVNDLWDVMSWLEPRMSKLAAESVEESKQLAEGEEDKAEIIMAAKDMVDRLTGWMEDTAEMQTESMLELADAIRDELGSEQSESFASQVKPALESLYAEMEQARGVLTQGVGLLTGEADDMGMMGADDGMEDPGMEGDMEPTVDDDMGDGDMDDMAAGGEEDLGGEDDFGASGAADGGAELAGRDKRESKQNRRKMIESSRRIASILSKKK